MRIIIDKKNQILRDAIEKKTQILCGYEKNEEFRVCWSNDKLV